MKKLNPFRLTRERVPSVKTLRQITAKCAVDNACLLRRVLRHGSRDELGVFIEDHEADMPQNAKVVAELLRTALARADEAGGGRRAT